MDIEALSGQQLSALPPLRGAIIKLMVAELRPVIAEKDVQETASVDPSRARAYLSILCSNNVLRTASDGFARGPQFTEWSTAACRSRPRQSANPSGDRMYEIFRTTAKNVRRLREGKGWSQNELGRRAGIDPKTVWRIESLRRRNIPFPALVLIAEALDTELQVITAKC